MVENTKKHMLLYKSGTTLVGLLLIFLIKFQAHEIQTEEQKYDLVYPVELIKLAESLGMEPIGGEKFWNSIITYGGQGLPYIFNVLTKVPIGKSKMPTNVIFWCQKDKKNISYMQRITK
jgi:hypothetical protein